MLNFILPRVNQEGREAHQLFQWYGEWIYLIQRGKGTMANSGERTMLSCISVTKGTACTYDSSFMGYMKYTDSCFRGMCPCSKTLLSQAKSAVVGAVQ